MLRPSWPALLGVAIATVLFAAPNAARADDDCPPGSTHRSVDGYTFCEATVCESDGNCGTGEVCRPVALCLQIGTLDRDGAALSGGLDKRLVVTQRCGPDKSCPQNTVCSDKKRCLARAAAEKMGILSAAPSAAPGAPGEPGKRACGCTTPGARTKSATVAMASLAGLALAVAARRRRRT